MKLFKQRMENTLNLKEQHPNCGTPQCCGKCDTAVTEVSKTWEEGIDKLVNKYKKDTLNA